MGNTSNMQKEIEKEIAQLEEIADSEINEELSLVADAIAEKMVQKTSQKHRFFKRIL